MTNKLGSSNPNRLPKKSKKTLTQQELADILSDEFPIESSGNQILDLIDRSKLSKDELKRLKEEYDNQDRINRNIALKIFNEQIKSDGKTDELGVPTSIGVKKALDKVKSQFMKDAQIPADLLESVYKGNKDITIEESEQIVAGLVIADAEEKWFTFNKFFEKLEKEIMGKFQNVIRANEKVAVKSVLRKVTKPKASDEDKEKLIKRNKAIRLKFFKLTQNLKSQRAFEILSREYKKSISTIRDIVYKSNKK